MQVVTQALEAHYGEQVTHIWEVRWGVDYIVRLTNGLFLEVVLTGSGLLVRPAGEATPWEEVSG